jgi:hypothetical protein
VHLHLGFAGDAVNGARAHGCPHPGGSGSKVSIMPGHGPATTA